MAEEIYSGMSDEGRQNVQGIIDRLGKVGEAIGGWSAKTDARQTGISYHAKFEKKVDVVTSMDFAGQLGQCPALLTNACERLLLADAEIKRLRAEADEAFHEGAAHMSHHASEVD